MLLYKDMNEHPHGFLLVDKPAGITSHDVIDRLRKITGIKRIGHAGTLDPFATGLLIVAVSREATKQISQFSKLDKTYEAEFVLGATSETLDPDSEVVVVGAGLRARPEIETAMTTLTGDILQIPPMYAAIKVKGKKLYELAREGKTIEREPRPVTIFSFELLEEPTVEDGLTVLKIRTRVSSGTYIRALARDLAAALHTEGYVRSLRRTSIDHFDVKNAMPLDEISQDNWQAALLSHPERA